MFLQSFCIGPFIKNAPEIFEVKYHMNLQETGIIIAIPDMLLVLMALVQGLVLDNYGYRCYFIIFSFCVLLFSQVIFYVTQECSVEEKCFRSVAPMIVFSTGASILQLTLETGFIIVVR